MAELKQELVTVKACFLVRCLSLPWLPVRSLKTELAAVSHWLLRWISASRTDQNEPMPIGIKNERIQIARGELLNLKTRAQSVIRSRVCGKRSFIFRFDRSELASVGKLKEELSFLKAGSYVRSWVFPHYELPVALFWRLASRVSSSDDLIWPWYVAFPRQVDPLDLLPFAQGGVSKIRRRVSHPVPTEASGGERAVPRAASSGVFLAVAALHAVAHGVRRAWWLWVPQVPSIATLRAKVQSLWQVQNFGLSQEFVARDQSPGELAHSAERWTSILVEIVESAMLNAQLQQFAQRRGHNVPFRAAAEGFVASSGDLDWEDYEIDHRKLLTACITSENCVSQSVSVTRGRNLDIRLPIELSSFRTGGLVGVRDTAALAKVAACCNAPRSILVFLSVLMSFVYASLTVEELLNLKTDAQPAAGEQQHEAEASMAQLKEELSWIKASMAALKQELVTVKACFLVRLEDGAGCCAALAAALDQREQELLNLKTDAQPAAGQQQHEAEASMGQLKEELSWIKASLEQVQQWISQGAAERAISRQKACPFNVFQLARNRDQDQASMAALKQELVTVKACFLVRLEDGAGSRIALAPALDQREQASVGKLKEELSFLKAGSYIRSWVVPHYELPVALFWRLAPRVSSSDDRGVSKIRRCVSHPVLTEASGGERVLQAFLSIYQEKLDCDWGSLSVWNYLEDLQAHKLLDELLVLKTHAQPEIVVFSVWAEVDDTDIVELKQELAAVKASLEGAQEQKTWSYDDYPAWGLKMPLDPIQHWLPRWFSASRIGHSMMICLLMLIYVFIFILILEELLSEHVAVQDAWQAPGASAAQLMEELGWMKDPFSARMIQQERSKSLREHSEERILVAEDPFSARMIQQEPSKSLREVSEERILDPFSARMIQQEPSKSRESCMTDSGCVCEEESELSCVDQGGKTFCLPKEHYQLCPLQCAWNQMVCQMIAFPTPDNEIAVDYCLDDASAWHCPLFCDPATAQQCGSGGWDSFCRSASMECPLICDDSEYICGVVGYVDGESTVVSKQCMRYYDECPCDDATAHRCYRFAGDSGYCEDVTKECPLVCADTEKKCQLISFTEDGQLDFSGPVEESCELHERPCPCGRNAQLCRWKDIIWGTISEACYPTTESCPVSCEAGEKACQVIDFAPDGNPIAQTNEICVAEELPCPCGANSQICRMPSGDICRALIDPGTGFAFQCPVICAADETECIHKSYDAEGKFAFSEKECVADASACNECKGQNSFLCRQQGQRDCLPLNGGFCPAECEEGEVRCPMVDDYAPDGTYLGSVGPSVPCAANLDNCPCGQEAKNCTGTTSRCIYKGDDCPVVCEADEKRCSVMDFSEDETLIGERQLCVGKTELCPCGENTERCPGSSICLALSTIDLVCPCSPSETQCDIQDYTREGNAAGLTTQCVSFGAQCPCGTNAISCRDTYTDEQFCLPKFMGGGIAANSCPEPCGPAAEPELQMCLL
ncbi:unnamed protein product [Symbiodinium sp. CCMP2592]|nr:unnamed protein product [Symbiodinium sp. CCMP2592]